MKPINERLAWLAGILDGEGYLSATKTRDKAFRSAQIGRPRKGEVRVLRSVDEHSLRFQIRVGNTDAGMINEIASIADSLGIKYFVFSHKQKNPRAKLMWGIHFHGKDRTKRLLTAVKPWLITKRPQADLLLEMIARREELKVHMGSLADPVLYEQLVRLRGLNRRGIGGIAVTAPDQFSAKNTRQESFPRDVVGGELGRQHPHLGGSAAPSKEPSEGIGESQRR